MPASSPPSKVYIFFFIYQIEIVVKLSSLALMVPFLPPTMRTSFSFACCQLFRAEKYTVKIKCGPDILLPPKVQYVAHSYKSCQLFGCFCPPFYSLMYRKWGVHIKVYPSLVAIQDTIIKWQVYFCFAFELSFHN